MNVTDMAKIVFNLVVVYLIGGLILAFVYARTSPVLYKKAEEEKREALKTMMPEADDIVKLGDWEPHEKHAEYYVAKKCAEVNVKNITDKETGKVQEVKECIGPEDIGYIVEGFGKGYSSYIHVLASVDKNFIVQKISILGHGETPGLGDEIEREYFLSRFKGRSLDNLVVVKAETEDKIQAITGATISSRAVTEDAVKNGVKMLTEKIPGGVEG